MIGARDLTRSPGMEQTMTEASAHESAAQAPATVADIMRPASTTVDVNDHVAAAAYLMKREGATALVVLDGRRTNRPIGIITEADIVRTVADGKDVNDVRILDLMTARPAVISSTTSIRDAAETMKNGRFRHLPVVEDGALIGMVDITDVGQALLNPPPE
jgi:CBS domain-containing protein